MKAARSSASIIVVVLVKFYICGGLWALWTYGQQVGLIAHVQGGSVLCTSRPRAGRREGGSGGAGAALAGGEGSPIGCKLYGFAVGVSYILSSMAYSEFGQSRAASRSQQQGSYERSRLSASGPHRLRHSLQILRY